jgi:hypothetical protein
MKRNVALLVLLNVFIFAYFQWPDSASSNAHQSLPELHPEKIHLLSDKALQDLQVGNSNQAAEVSAIPTTTQCFEWGNFTAVNLKKAQELLSQLGLQSQLLEKASQEAKPFQENKRFWIYIPPAASQAIAEKKIGVLRQHGIEQTFIMQDEKWRYAISLGMFQDEKLADNLLKEVKNKGIKAALKGVRNREAGQSQLALNNVPIDKLEALNKAKLEFKDAELKEVTCH